MKTSEQINELATALAIAQGQIKNAVADAKNPHYNSSYADLASVRAAVQKPLSDNGLSIVQVPTTIEQKHALTTRLMHKSGQYLEDTVVLIVEKPTMQGLGSALTYAKRYGITSVTGLAEEDDDGTAAEKHPVITIPSGLPKPVTLDVPKVTNPKKALLSPAQYKLIVTRLDQRLGIKEIDAGPFLMEVIGKPSIALLEKHEVNPVLQQIDNEANMRAEANQDVPQ